MRSTGHPLFPTIRLMLSPHIMNHAPSSGLPVLERWVSGPRFGALPLPEGGSPAPALSFEFFPRRRKRWRPSFGPASAGWRPWVRASYR